MKIPLVDLKAQYNALREEIDGAIRKVIESGQFILGPEVAAFESEIAAYCQTKYAVGVASGTDALRLALLACGIKSGDEVITTPFTFIATTEAITDCGATPVFVDIDPVTFNLDPAKIEPKITSKTAAILPVHLYGHPADMGPIVSLARKYNLKIIEDCAQALGAEYKGKKVGSLGDAGCLSFFPSKVLGAYGDGGMVVTSHPEIMKMVTMLRNHGAQKKHFSLVSGFNSRLDDLQAAVLRVKFKNLDSWIKLRRQKAGLYSRLFDQIVGIKPPQAMRDSYHVYNYYTIRVTGEKLNRGSLQKHLNDNGVSTAVYYPLSLHMQQVYHYLKHKPGDFPECERAQGEVLSLPIYPELEDAEIEQIIKTMESLG